MSQVQRGPYEHPYRPRLNQRPLGRVENPPRGLLLSSSSNSNRSKTIRWRTPRARLCQTPANRLPLFPSPHEMPQQNTVVLSLAPPLPLPLSYHQSFPLQDKRCSDIESSTATFDFIPQLYHWKIDSSLPFRPPHVSRARICSTVSYISKPDNTPHNPSSRISQKLHRCAVASSRLRHNHLEVISKASK